MAIVTRDVRENALWLLDLSQQGRARVTLDGEFFWPKWTPDGQRLVIVARPQGKQSLLCFRPEGSDKPQVLMDFDFRQFIVSTSWLPGGESLAVTLTHDERTWDIELLTSIGSLGNLQPLINTRFNEVCPTFHPSGRWLAYVSDESGQREVYLQSYPGHGRRWKVSTQGGTAPVWSRDGRELFYESLPDSDGKKWLMAVKLTTAPTISFTVPQRVFETTAMGLGSVMPAPQYEVLPDGQRFLFIQRLEDQPTAAVSRINLVMNWFEELKRLCPTGKN